MSLFWFVVIGAIAGWLAGQFMKGSGFGLVGDIVVGVIGAFVGGYVFRAAGVGVGGFAGSLVVAFIGAIILLFVVRLFTSRRSGRSRLWS
jgi:uncharacterized membrane protein YeaQ/YmgE (transglycosylase-associated protein family)